MGKPTRSLGDIFSQGVKKALKARPGSMHGKIAGELKKIYTTENMEKAEERVGKKLTEQRDELERIGKLQKDSKKIFDQNNLSNSESEILRELERREIALKNNVKKLELAQSVTGRLMQTASVIESVEEGAMSNAEAYINYVFDHLGFKSNIAK